MYTTHFGFANPPFRSRNNQVFVTGPTYESAYSCLRQGLEQRRGILLLTGPSGAGKTTLLHRLTRELAAQAHFIFIWNPHQSFDDLLNYLCDNLKLAVPSSELDQKLKVLETYLLSQIVKGRETILIIDDAQQLPTEILEGLRSLVSLKIAGQILLQIILSGPSSLGARLSEEPTQRPLAKDINQHCQLSPLSDQEVIQYVREQLKAAGYKGGELFREDALDKIISYAQGLPRLINLICNQALFLAYLNAETSIPAGLIREVGVTSELQEGPPPTLHIPIAKHSPKVSAPLKPKTPRSGAVPNPIALSAAPPIVTDELPAIPIEPSTLPRLRRPYRRRPWLTISLCLLAIASIAFTMRHITLEQLTKLLESTWQSLIPSENPAMPTPISPPLHADAVINERIQGLLKKAEGQMKSMDFVAPRGESALDSYREVLKLDPGNKEALQGIARMKISFLDWADLAELRGDLAKAKEYLEIALIIDPDDASVRARLNKIIQKQRLNPATQNN